MARSRTVVFANGEYDHASGAFAKVSDDDFIVCVDGGVRHCLSAGLKPDLLLGDLDSLDESSARVIAQLGTEQMQYPVEKDASDLELAFEYLSTKSCKQVVLLGASGGRTDHHLFNWQHIASRSWPFQLRVIDSHVDAQLIDSASAFDGSPTPGTTFSVIPLVKVAKGVDVSGAQYPLVKATIAPGSTIGLSNVVTESRLQVSVEEGIVMLMLVHAIR